jgi:hypothetical protein
VFYYGRHVQAAIGYNFRGKTFTVRNDARGFIIRGCHCHTVVIVDCCLRFALGLRQKLDHQAARRLPFCLGRAPGSGQLFGQFQLFISDGNDG